MIRKIGEGNFTQIYQVEHKKSKRQYALKVCDSRKVANLRKETDILMEKHALNKLAELYPEELPCVKLIGTFKDAEHLYFLQELLQPKLEVWLACRNYGLLSDSRTR